MSETNVTETFSLPKSVIRILLDVANQTSCQTSRVKALQTLIKEDVDVDEFLKLEQGETEVDDTQSPVFDTQFFKQLAGAE